MAKMGFCIFKDSIRETDLVAPKADYPSSSDFLRTCEIEGEGAPWFDKVKAENVKVAYCRYYPTAPEGVDIDGGCYSFSRPGKGAFPVWRIALQ